MGLLAQKEVIQWGSGRLIVQDFVAEGRTCEVYSSISSLKTGPKHVAVKVFKPGENCEGGMVRELELLKRMSAGSQFLVHLMGAVVHDSKHCLIEELLTPLPHVLANYERGKMSLWETRSLLRDICRGLEELHAAGFVHADLKPSNIGWSCLSAGFRLTDFGISFHLSEGSHIHAVQTWGYIAPETAAWNARLAANPRSSPRRRVRWSQPDEADSWDSSASCGSCPLSPKIDMWSVGCVAYQVLAAKKFIPTPRGKTFDSQKEIDDYFDEFVDLSDLDPKFCDFLRRCVVWDPALRMSPSDALAHNFLEETVLDRQFASILPAPKASI